MNIIDRYPYEGPRTPDQNEYEALMELDRSIFFKDHPVYRDAVRTWPMYLRQDLWENTFAMFYQGQPVSAISRLTRDVLFHGLALRMGFVGGVCTHPDHRGKGLASTILDATLQRFVDTDVDFVYISGSRSMYYRAGANHIGGLSQFLLTSDAAKLVDTENINIRQATLADVEILYSLNETEQIWLAHDRLDYELIIQNGHCSGGQCVFNIIELESTPVGYVAVRNVARKEGRWSQRVIEFAGDRGAILAGLVVLADRHGVNGHLIIETHREEELAARLRSMGVECKTGRMGGTVKVLNFTRAMEKLRPYFSQRLGSSFAQSLEFAAGRERYIASGEGGALEIDGEVNMLRTLLGAPPDGKLENVRATGLMQKALEVCLPIPLPALPLNVI